MFLKELDPEISPLSLWHLDYSPERADKLKEYAKEHHSGIIKLFKAMMEHSHASVIPTHSSMMWFCLGNKKDIISLVYSYTDSTIRIEYRPQKPCADNPLNDGEWIGKPQDAIPLVNQLLDLFVSRHKRLGKPN